MADKPTDWNEEVQCMLDALQEARDKGMSDEEIAEVMYGEANRLAFFARVELGEFSTTDV